MHSVLTATAAAFITLGNICLAQTPDPSPGPRREFESRAELEAQASAAEAQHRPGEAWLLRQRLTKGDFQDGDRIVIDVQGSALVVKPDTHTVRAGKRLEFPRMADVQLEGVLRSELSDRLTQHLAQYIKEPVVRATPLVRVAILGSVKNPGYFYTAADIPLSDVIMKAGGPTQVANINNVVVRRNAEVIWDPKGMRTAIADGLSIDRLHMRAGDEIYVAEQRKFPWWSVISTGVSVLLLIATQFR